MFERLLDSWCMRAAGEVVELVAMMAATREVARTVGDAVGCPGQPRIAIRRGLSSSGRGRLKRSTPFSSCASIRSGSMR
jgi:hypothetical protein